jgi:hypothetical protein
MQTNARTRSSSKSSSREARRSYITICGRWSAN